MEATIIINEFKILQEIVKNGKAPYSKFIIDIVEYPGWWALRLYRDNIESYSENQKVALFEYVNGLLILANKADVKTFLEVYEHAGQIRR